MVKPEISFVMAAYNNFQWIAEAIESLRKQTIENIEIIVVDDCSQDSTPEVVNWYAEKDHRIMSVRNKKNMGAGLSRNIGNNLAGADIICVCDSDDYYPDDRAKYTLEQFKNKKIDMINGSYHRVNYSNQITESYPGEEFNYENFKNSKPFYFCHPSAAYRRKDALLIPYRRETKDFTDDRMFVDDWIKAGKTITWCDHFLAFHRVLPGSMTTVMRGGSLE